MLQGAQMRTLAWQYLWKTARNRKDGDDALSCKDAVSDGMIEHLTRMWARSHLLYDGSAEHPCSVLWSRMVLAAVPPLNKDFPFLI